MATAGLEATGHTGTTKSRRQNALIGVNASKQKSSRPLLTGRPGEIPDQNRAQADHQQSDNEHLLADSAANRGAFPAGLEGGIVQIPTLIR